MARKFQKQLSRFLSIEKADFLGTEFQLYSKNNGHFKTKVGGVFSIVVAAMVGVVAYNSFRNLLSTTSPVATISTVFSEESPKFDLVKEQMFFHFAFVNAGRTYVGSKEMPEINRFFTIKAFIVEDQGKNENGQRKTKYP